MLAAKYGWHSSGNKVTKCITKGDLGHSDELTADVFTGCTLSGQTSAQGL